LLELVEDFPVERANRVDDGVQEAQHLVHASEIFAVRLRRIVLVLLTSQLVSHPSHFAQKVTGAPPINFADFARRSAQAWT
jgi:hypothetical protein